MSHKIARAKSVLILDQPFFASLLFSMDIIEDSSVKTMATNGEEIRYNPEFLESMTDGETVFVMAHETMHAVLQHMHRRGTRNHNRYNIAADYVINDLLVKEKIGTMPKGCLLDPSLVAQGGGTTEGVYDLLPESSESKEAGDEGGSMDEVQDAGKDQAETAEKEAEMRVKIVQAANAAKMQGKLTPGIERLVGELTATRQNWKELLRRFLSERTKSELSYAKPKRRFMAEDINLPSLTGEKLGSIVVAVDCSGSINDDLLAKFSNELAGIVQDTMPSTVHVIYFDSEVSHMDTLSPANGDDFKLTAHGGGGTAFSPIFKHIEANDLNPVAVVVLTDLYCSDFGPAPSYPVLWASTGSNQAPFGDVIEIKE